MYSYFKNGRLNISIILFILSITIIPSLNVVQTRSATDSRYGGWLIDCSYADADLYNPVISADSTSSYIEDFIFEGMMTYDKDMNIIPGLASSWEVSLGKRDYTFYLREDVYWHDNQQFTADDVIFTWDRILDSRTQTTRRSMFDLLDFEYGPYEKLDDFTVVFYLQTTFTPMLNNMMFPIIPEHIFGSYSPAEGEGEYEFNDCPPNYAPVGTGSMMFDKWIHDDQIILKRNSQDNGGPGYWREHDAYLDGIIVKIIPEVTTQLSALKSGEIDMMDMSSTEASEIEAIRDNPNFTLFNAPQFTSDHIAFNCDPSKGHHADTRDFEAEPNYFAGFEWMEDDPIKLPGPNIRKALNYAIDKDQLIEVAYPHGFRNLGPMYLAQSYWYLEDVEHYDYNLTKANQLLNAAGFGVDKNDPLRDELKFTISYNTGNVRRQTICNYAKSQWELLGLDISVESVERISMLNSHYDHRKFDAMSAGWTGDGGDPDLKNEWHSKNIEPGGTPVSWDPDTNVWTWDSEPVPGGLNYMGYWNPTVDNLLNIAREEPEQFARSLYYDQIQKKIIDDSPYVWLLAHVTLQAVYSSVQGMINGSVMGLWPQPVGFHNIWKSSSGNTSVTTSSGSTELDSPFSFLVPGYELWIVMVIAGLVGINRRRKRV